MPSLQTRVPAYKPDKKIVIEWEGWDGGWNNYFNPTEIKPNELAETTNLMLVGRGTVTGRWGTANYHLAGSGSVRLLSDYLVPENSLNELISLTDLGTLVKKSGISYTAIVGASWPSGTTARAAQLGGSLYITSKERELVRYSGATLISYVTLSKPTSVAVTNISGVSGTWTYGWRVNTISISGDTLASDTVQLVNLPQDLTTTRVRVSWVAPSAASGMLVGFGIYRGSAGGERLLATVDGNTTTFIDEGSTPSETILPPVADTTGGPRAGHILGLDDRLVLSDFSTDPSLVMISARYPYESRFNWAYGGGYIKVSPNDGDTVRCTSFVGSNTKGGNVPSTILVFKERKTFAMVLKTVTIGNYVILDPQYQELLPLGTKSPDSVVRVENDVFFLSPDGIYSVGSEASYLNEIRSKEISTRIRNYMAGLTETDFQSACASYIDHKYVLSFPNRMETIIYDYERRAFMGTWKTPFGITKLFKYYDSDDTEKWLIGASDGYVKYFAPSLNTDVSTAIAKKALTRKEPYGDWTKMKIFELFYILLRSVRGSVNVTLLGEDRDGQTVNIKSFTITGAASGSAGYGTSQYGTELYGLSNSSVNVTSDDFVRWTQPFKTVRTIQIEVSSSGAGDNWQLIATRLEGKGLGIGSLSPSTRV